MKKCLKKGIMMAAGGALALTALAFCKNKKNGIPRGVLTENAADGQPDEAPVVSEKTDLEAVKKKYVVVTDYVKANTGRDVSEELQRLIDTNPQRTIFFPDGEYTISKPLLTSANPANAVSFELANFAVIKAAEGWSSEEAMIRLGAGEHYNTIRINGSNYSFVGGIIDGSGVANGIAIESGRETSVRCVSIKNTKIGLHIKKGANSNSSDADVFNVNIVCNATPESIGLLVEGLDNTFTNMRIAYAQIGVKLASSANYLRNIHPLNGYMGTLSYRDSIGFWDRGGNWFDTCYSDQYRVGYRVGNNSVYSMCRAFWYTDRGDAQIGFVAEEQMNASILHCQATFNYDTVENAFLKVGAEGGSGIIQSPMFSEERNADNCYKQYLVGEVLST